MRVLLLLLLLAGCTWLDPQAAAQSDEAKCTAYGHQAGTAAHAACRQSLDQDRSAAILNWALWSDRPRAQYRHRPAPGYYQRERFVRCYRTGQTFNCLGF